MLINYNPNPCGKNTGDCVIRAISKILDMTWQKVYWELSAKGSSMCEWGDSNSVWGAYLHSKGYKKSIIPDTCPDCYTIADFAADHPQGEYIVATGKHVVAVVDGDIYDSLDSAGEIPTYFFYKEI